MFDFKNCYRFRLNRVARFSDKLEREATGNKGGRLGQHFRSCLWVILTLLLVTTARAELRNESGLLGLNTKLLASNSDMPSPTPVGFAPGILVAQSDGDDAYDPFADYSEFEEAMEEEEEINFFRNGRLFTLGFIGGYRTFTGNLAKIYSGDPAFGLFMSFFFDLRFALQFGFLTGSHSLSIKGPNEHILGTVNLTDISFNLKYYFNTQNVTRGLADLNPYIFAGASHLMRTRTVDSSADLVAKDSAWGFNGGLGIEIPIMRNKMFIGLQGAYQLINFADENKYVRESDDVTRIIKPSGDSYTVLGILGSNF